jgi:hypothetical protein
MGICICQSSCLHATCYLLLRQLFSKQRQFACNAVARFCHQRLHSTVRKTVMATDHSDLKQALAIVLVRKRGQAAREAQVWPTSGAHSMSCTCLLTRPTMCSVAGRPGSAKQKAWRR